MCCNAEIAITEGFKQPDLLALGIHQPCQNDVQQERGNREKDRRQNARHDAELIEFGI